MSDAPDKPIQNGTSSQSKQSLAQGTTGEMSRPNHLQRIAQKKAIVLNYPKTKKLEKLAVYSSCKVLFAIRTLSFAIGKELWQNI